MKERSIVLGKLWIWRKYGIWRFGGFGGYGGSQSNSGYQDEEAIRRQAASNYVQSGHYQEAMNVLSSLKERNAQWYYLSAVANMGLGNNVNAMNHIREAVRLEPDNMQYRMMLQRMEAAEAGIRNSRIHLAECPQLAMISV